MSIGNKIDAICTGAIMLTVCCVLLYGVFPLFNAYAYDHMQIL